MSIDLHYFSIDKARFEKILDFLPYPFLISSLRDKTYINLYLNQKFAQEIGYSLNDIPTIEEWFMKAYPSEDHRIEVKKQWSEEFDNAKREGKDFVLMKVLIHTKTNGTRWYEVKASLFGPMQMVAFVDAHSETLKEKELEMENRNHNITLSILSHDLRSPISNLKSLTELVSTGQISPNEFQEMIKKLNEKSQQVLDLLDTTLLWTKSNFDGLKVKKENVNIQSVVKEIIQVYESTHQAKQLMVTNHVDCEDQVADKEIISIILRNLISNAIKFTPSGGTIDISALKNQDHFTLSVSDSGSGFDSKVLEELISNRFAFNHDLRRGHGHGIGLTLSRQLLEKMEGSMEISSEPDHGTVVKIILPRI